MSLAAVTASVVLEISLPPPFFPQKAKDKEAAGHDKSSRFWLLWQFSLQSNLPQVHPHCRRSSEPKNVVHKRAVTRDPLTILAEMITKYFLDTIIF